MSRSSKRHPAVVCWVICILSCPAFSGCQSPLKLFRAQSPDQQAEVEVELDLEEESSTRFVRDLAVPTGMGYTKIEGVALVTGLKRTGSDPPPSPNRQRLIDEMQTHEVAKPNEILASPSTSMVVVRGYLPPGIQKGDRFDIEVSTVAGSKTSSLREGWLMQTRMREFAVLNHSVHTGHVEALAQGNVVVDAVFNRDKGEASETRGRVLGGGRALRSRPLGLVIRDSYTSPRTSSAILAAVNNRFHYFDRGIKKGVATPKYSNFVELALPPRYKHNVARFMQVVRYIAIGETAAERATRLQSLEARLLEPTSAANAALQLEAIGHEGIIVLKKGLASEDPEVLFYASEALAYLDETEAAEVLGETARSERAFRWHSLTALSTMDHVAAYDALAQLIDDNSAETRYGAFRAMRARNPRDPTLGGEVLGGQFTLHQLSTAGPPLIHFAAYRRPEIVLFGHDQRIDPPTFLFAGKNIMIKGIANDRVRLTRFKAGEEDVQLECGNRVDEIIRSIVELDGSYTDVYQALDSAKRGDYLKSRLVVDARARRGRSYSRPDPAAEDEADVRFDVASPIPEMFSDPAHRQQKPDDSDDGDIDPPKSPPEPGFFGKMTGWLSGSDETY